ncbi:MAG: AAA family ATPase [Persicimonas sp.]
MNRRTVELDILLDVRPDCVLAYLFGEEKIAAAASSVDGAIEQVERLVQKIASARPWALGGDDETNRPSLRIVSLEVPVVETHAVFPIEVRLLVATRPKESRTEVYVPEVPLHFEILDVDQLVDAATEYLCDQFPAGKRIGALQPFLDVADDGSSSRDLRVRRLEIEVEAGETGEQSANGTTTPTLEAVGEPLHERLDKKDAPRAFERDQDVEALLGYLSDEWERSVLLVGPAGVGKTAIVQDAVGRITRGEAPAGLEKAGVWQISGGRLMAGMRYLGQWQERVLDVIAEATRTGAILFADNLVELLEASGNEEYAEGIPGLLLPHIASGDLVLVTEARPEQLAFVEHRQPSFLRALRRLPVEPMSTAQTDAVLERVSYRLGRQHGVRLADETRQSIIELTGRFGGTGAAPGPAVDLAERMARTHRKQGVEREGSARPELQPKHAIEAFAAQTGLPIELLDPGVDFEVEQVEAFFEDAVFDQPEATTAMVDLVSVIRAGLNPPDRPFGSYLFLGPTGVGKTQTALTLARYLFGSQDRLLRFDMSEYQDPWSAARLVGRYKGEEGDLVRRVREQPFQVILLDEIEKAHASVFDLLLQVMGEGRLTDALGQTVPMTGSVIIMTSNLGSDGPESLGFDAAVDHAEVERQHFLSAVESFFRPEFVGRVDRIIPFRSLGRRTARRLVERALEEAFSREGLERRGIEVTATDEVIDYLIRTGFDARYGARPLRQAVENHVTATLAEFLSSHGELGGANLLFRMVDGVPTLVRDDV